MQPILRGLRHLPPFGKPRRRVCPGEVVQETREPTPSGLPAVVERGDDEVGRLVVVIRVELVKEETVLGGEGSDDDCDRKDTDQDQRDYYSPSGYDGAFHQLPHEVEGRSQLACDADSSGGIKYVETVSGS